MSEKKDQKIIKKITEELLVLLGIEADIEIRENDDGYEIILDTPDSGIVIGHHGDILESLQLILSLCISRSLKEFKRISVEVGEYRKNREDWLKNLAQETKDKVLSERREFTLPMLKAWERRIIHLTFQNDDEVMTESVGDGKDRVLVVRPKT
ncbi:MAG: KH domain-containing protein [Candidatus Levybacteria bacterium]|nr:KH domain-containing protein [Candidatus Levybacteria bacterium]